MTIKVENKKSGGNAPVASDHYLQIWRAKWPYMRTVYKAYERIGSNPKYKSLLTKALTQSATIFLSAPWLIYLSYCSCTKIILITVTGSQIMA